MGMLPGRILRASKEAVKTPSGPKWLTIYRKRTYGKVDIWGWRLIEFEAGGDMKNFYRHQEDEQRQSFTDLAAELAHEVRNPLGSIELLASLLMKSTDDETNIRRAAQIISAVKEINERITNIMVSTRKREIAFVKIHIHDILREILQFSEIMLDGKTLFLLMKYSPSEPMVYGNGEMLKQLFLMLILNALQSIQEGEYLFIETRFSNEEVEGPKSPSSHNSGHFEIRFSMKTNTENRASVRAVNSLEWMLQKEEMKTGLGIAVVSSIVEMHQGSVHLGKDEDTMVFCISLPAFVEQG
jgi:nitrogen-specific signal transduction histidine kinase